MSMGVYMYVYVLEDSNPAATPPAPCGTRAGLELTHADCRHEHFGHKIQSQDPSAPKRQVRSGVSRDMGRGAKTSAENRGSLGIRVPPRPTQSKSLNSGWNTKSCEH